MDGMIELQGVDKLRSAADTLGNVYAQISFAHGDLVRDHDRIRQCWVDNRVDEFSANYETAMDYLWDLMVAISNMQEFLTFAADGYAEAERLVRAL